MLGLNLENLEDRQMLSSVDIFVAGATNDETIELKIDDQTVQVWNNIGGNANQGEFQTLSYTSNETITADRLKIEFVNDAYDPSSNYDRNVRVDKIIVDGKVHEAEHASVFSTGTWRLEDGIVPGFRQSEYLQSNGYLQFSDQAQGHGSQIQVDVRGLTGDEEFTLEVEGVELAYWQAGSEFQTFTVFTTQDAKPGDVRINFVNDIYDPNSGYDRNLQVDRIIINGQVIETESGDVFSTGTWRTEDGISPGNRQSETLHANGYFRFGLDAGLSDVIARSEFGVSNEIEDIRDPSLATTTLRRVTATSYPGDGSGIQWDAPEPSTNPQVPPNAPNNTGTAVQPLRITDNIYAPGSEENQPNSGGLNEYSQFFAQFVTHDLVHSVRSPGPPIFYEGQFIPVSRTPAVVGADGVLQQVSSDTPTLDLGLVYGRDSASTELLREVVNVNGQDVNGARLIAGGAGDVLPSYAEVAYARGMSVEDVQRTLGTTFLNLPPEALANQVATGDERANQTTSLTVHHTIWHRNHNWHVDQLRVENPEWTEEQLYEAARALNEAEYQRIIYEEYLPKLIGYDQLSEYSGFDPTVDNRIINEWTTVAFRFGHDQASNGQITISENGEINFIPLEVSSLIANNGQNIDTDEQLGDWTRGQLAQSSQEIDGRIVPSLRNALFGVPANQDGNDGSESEFLQLNLPLLDIHRGRDHGVSDYNQLRAGLGLSTYDSLDEFAWTNGLEEERLSQLKSVYSDISELDSIVGGLLEAKVPGSQLGETFTLLNVMQWEATRDGDEFFYLNRFKDSSEVLNQINSTSMADILVRNGVVDNAYVDAFQSHSQFVGTQWDDVIYGTPGRDLIVGLPGNDQLTGGEGNDSIFGGYGNDWLNGQGQNDFLDGGPGNDNLNGGWGNDLLVGGEGYDTLVGGPGNDTFVFYPGSGNDVVVDFSYGDRLYVADFGFESFAEFESFTSNQGNTLVISVGSDALTLQGVYNLGPGEITI